MRFSSIHLILNLDASLPLLSAGYYITFAKTKDWRKSENLRDWRSTTKMH
jgi:hypothetical protein